jgi:hypothetical protein
VAGRWARNQRDRQGKYIPIPTEGPARSRLIGPCGLPLCDNCGGLSQVRQASRAAPAAALGGAALRARHDAPRGRRAEASPLPAAACRDRALFQGTQATDRLSISAVPPGRAARPIHCARGVTRNAPVRMREQKGVSAGGTGLFVTTSRFPSSDGRAGTRNGNIETPPRRCAPGARSPEPTSEEAFLAREGLDAPRLIEWMTMTQEDFSTDRRAPDGWIIPGRSRRLAERSHGTASAGRSPRNSR